MTLSTSPTVSRPASYVTRTDRVCAEHVVDSNIVDLLSVCVDALDREGQRLAVLRQHFGYGLGSLSRPLFG